MKRRDMLASLGLVALGGSTCAAAEPAPKDAPRIKGGPAITAEDLAAAIRKEGFQWRFVGSRITFTAVVRAATESPSVRIDGMDKDKLDTAALHHVGGDKRLKAGDKIQVEGLIVDQWYGVWQVWAYEVNPAAA